MNNKKYKYSQLILVEFNNCSPYLQLFQSNKEITITRIAKVLKKEGWGDSESDGLTCMDKPITVTI
jgi:hypothetical protein